MIIKVYTTLFLFLIYSIQVRVKVLEFSIWSY